MLIVAWDARVTLDTIYFAWLPITTWGPSWTITLIGPIHPPLLSPLFFQTITHDPLLYVPLSGRVRWTSARRSTWLLSTLTKALRARSLRANSSRNRIPSGRSWRVAMVCALICRSEVTEPGTIVLLPKTNVSGGYPLCRLHWFLVWVANERAWLRDS